jgi:hypothetical protein
VHTLYKTCQIVMTMFEKKFYGLGRSMAFTLISNFCTVNTNCYIHGEVSTELPHDNSKLKTLPYECTVHAVLLRTCLPPVVIYG